MRARGGLAGSQAAKNGAAPEPSRAVSAPLSASIAPMLLTEEEAAAVFGVSKRTFLNLRNEAWMPRAIVLGPRLLRWSTDELRAAVAEMPRQTDRVQPESLLRAKVDRLKTAGVPQ